MPVDVVITERVEDEYINTQAEKIAKDIIKKFDESPSQNILYVDDSRLYVMIINKNTGYWGSFTLTDDRFPTITINAHNDEECSKWFDEKKFDKIADKLYRVIHHECVHYINYIISGESNRCFSQEKIGYASKFNNPEEFNAYYHQMRNLFSKIANEKVKSAADFDSIFGDTTQKFIQFCWNTIKTINQDMYIEIRNDEVYRRKWMKRLYQLYFELKQKFCKGLSGK